jgi:hypothetical protein
VNTYSTGEFYTGASSYYGNFDLRLTKRETQQAFTSLATEAEKLALLQTRLTEGLVILLQQKYPNAVAEVDGLKVLYEVTYKTYDGTNTLTLTKVFKCTKVGPAPEFALN